VKVKRQQFIITGVAILVMAALLVFGKTVDPKKAEIKLNEVEHEHAAASTIQLSNLLTEAKEHISIDQNKRLTALENSVARGDVKEQQIHVYHQLARFWKDSSEFYPLYAYYTSEAAKLENSEKSLTFAAQLFLDRLLTMDDDPVWQNWLATNAKVLLDKALEINPANDSSRIGVGACYMFGNISNNPMEGILPVREIVQKNPSNLYAHWILGLGGKKSGQFDKAIEHFTFIYQKQPDNVDAALNAAECYEKKNDKVNAVKWYSMAKSQVKNAAVKKAIEERINTLK
jgi:tetratricopeptide (TPR) repeat protein